MTLVFRTLTLCLCVLLTCPLATLAQTETETTSRSAADDPEFAQPVVFEGEELFTVRGSSALPADERAEQISQRILEVAKSSTAKIVTMTSNEVAIGIEIVADGLLVSTATRADAELEKMDMAVVVDLQSNAIYDAILRYRESRTDEAIAQSTTMALVWTAVFVGYCAVILFVRNRLPSVVGRIVRRRFHAVQEATKEMVQSQAVARLAEYVMRMFLNLILFIGFYYFLSFVLLAFPETRPIASLLITYVTDPIVNLGKGALSYVPNLIIIGIISWITAFTIRGVRLFFENVEQGTIALKNFEPHWVWPTYSLIRLALILMAIVLSFPYIPGSDSAAFQGLTIFLGLMVSLGSNSVIANSLAGLFVLYKRSMKIGDRILVGEFYGDVIQIKLMETYLRTVKNELVSIPNAKLLASEVKNFSAKLDGKGLLLHTTVGIGYEEPREKIEAMLLEAAARTTGLKKTPAPFVLMEALADYAINYQVNAFTTRGSYLPRMLSDLHKNIVDVFNENEVQIMTPSYEMDTPEAKIAETVWQGELAPNARSDTEEA
ncbi:mechanosensitive ion channel domain-containing protein [uncultured Shimia sp.]|uniref:mechanosensitive ion channel family protein n=1 Tax=uncultured Shimia sp. TaxID=573152 RepID=UPI0026049FE9|nr:mechanosensitive ion channel domain-containing protein [uncultured Shimia sp.]